jgi:cytochrome c-type biogenesis protein CcmH/NrfG
VHAKWAFVLLAVVFALGFVFFGVGSGSTGISDALQNAFNFGNKGGTSISSLQSKTDKHPNDPTAWRNLATALEQKQRTQEAVTALERYTTLRPKDQGALAELASQYGTLATNYSNDYAVAQQQMAEQESPASAFGPPSTTPFGKALADPKALKNPISAAVATLANAKLQIAYSSYQSAQRNAESAYRRLVILNPSDATSQIQLGQAAQAAQDPTTAIKAFAEFIKLAPTDPLAPQVKQALQALRDQAASGANGTPSG